MAEKASKPVKARWIAPYEGQLPDGTILVSQKTEVELSEGEAIASDNWEVLSGGSTGGPSVKDLRQMAKDRGITIPKGAKKPDIEHLIGRHDAAPTPDPDPETSTDDASPPAGEGDQDSSEATSEGAED